MTPDLDAALAAEEHAQGRPYLAEPEHCETCARVDWAWEEAAFREHQAACGHEWYEAWYLDSRLPDRYCSRCGLRERP